jgi:hypothetical protein
MTTLRFGAIRDVVPSRLFNSFGVRYRYVTLKRSR